MSEAKEAALREALNSPMTGDERLRLSLILAEGGGEWEPDPDDAEATLDALDASRARIAALEEGLGLLVQDYESLWFSESGEATACRERLAPYRALLTPADPVEAPSDCHPQGE